MIIEHSSHQNYVLNYYLSSEPKQKYKIEVQTWNHITNHNKYNYSVMKNVIYY